MASFMTTRSFAQLRTEVFSLVAQIPRGKITTYKQLALAAGTGPRVIGRVLNTNTDSSTYPCHRVIKSDGTVASGYAFGGQTRQIELLQQEGVKFQHQRTDIEGYLWVNFNKV